MSTLHFSWLPFYHISEYSEYFVRWTSQIRTWICLNRKRDIYFHLECHCNCKFFLQLFEQQSSDSIKTFFGCFNVIYASSQVSANTDMYSFRVFSTCHQYYPVYSDKLRCNDERRGVCKQYSKKAKANYGGREREKMSIKSEFIHLVHYLQLQFAVKSMQTLAVKSSPVCTLANGTITKIYALRHLREGCSSCTTMWQWDARVLMWCERFA